MWQSREKQTTKQKTKTHHTKNQTNNALWRRKPCVPLISSVVEVKWNWCLKDVSNTTCQVGHKYFFTTHGSECWKRERGGGLRPEWVGFQHLFSPRPAVLVFCSPVTFLSPVEPTGGRAGAHPEHEPICRRAPRSGHCSIPRDGTQRQPSVFMYRTINLEWRYIYIYNNL